MAQSRRASQWEEVTKCQATYPRLVFTLAHNLKAHKSLSPSWSPDMLSHPGLLFWYNIRVFRPDLVASWLSPRWDRKGWGHSDHNLINSNKRQNISSTQQTHRRKSATFINTPADNPLKRARPQQNTPNVKRSRTCPRNTWAVHKEEWGLTW